MHDANGKELKVGDVVLVPVVITDLQATEEFCNVSAKSVYGRKPDGLNETLGGINTAIMLRYNKADTIAYDALDSVRPE